jgi:hypothetical protein
MKKWLILSGSLAFLVAFVLLFLSARPYPALQEDSGMKDLAMIARQMVSDNASGVGVAPTGNYISSFDSFFDYVSKKRPADVSSRDAPNPFPGILHGTSYYRMIGVATDGSSVLIHSQVYKRPIGNVTFTLYNNGAYVPIIK